jgi:hypothetical protein
VLYLDSFLLSIIFVLCFAHECVHGKYCVVLFCVVCVYYCFEFAIGENYSWEALFGLFFRC